MKITSLRYRTNNPTNPEYKTQHVELEVEVTEGDVDTAYEFARKEADRLLGIDFTDADIEAAEKLLAKARRAGRI